jgi:hypothetical protein
MIKFSLLASLLAAGLLGAACPEATAAEPAIPAPATLPAGPPQDHRMEWFRQAKFGLFIHWGLYAIPAGEWKGKPVRPSSEWIMAHVLLCLDPLISVMFLLCSLVSGPAPAYDNPSC